MIRNLRYGWRSLRRTPIFLAMAVATLGLGVGATTAVFSLFYQVLLRDLPVPQPEQLVVLHHSETFPGHTDSDNFESAFSYPLYLHLRDGSGAVLSGLAARSGLSVDVMRSGQTDRAQLETVSGNFFQVLGITPFAGRLLTPQDDTVRGGNNVAVLGYAYWEKTFGGASVVGQKILVNGHSVTVVGIAPPEFRSVLSGQTPALYMPISMEGITQPGFDAFDSPRTHWLTAIGRLRPGIARSQAQAALNPLFTSVLRDELPQMHIRSAHSQQRLLSQRLELHPAAEGVNDLERTWRKPLLVLLAAAAGLLLIACSNLAGLLLVRSSARQREIAIRRSLGATRPQIVWQLFSENMLLSVLGTALGVCLSIALTYGILHILPAGMTAGWVGTALNARIFLFALAICLAAGFAFGLLPAWQISADNAAAALKEQSRHVAAGAKQARARQALVVFEIAVCVVLLAGAGLFTKSLAKLLAHNPGFHSENLWAFTIDPALNGYTQGQALNFYARIRDRLAQLPGVSAVSLCDTRPYSNSDSSTNVSIQNYQPREDENMDSHRDIIAPGFFHTLGIPLVAGREFTPADAQGAQKAIIVNEAFVHRFLHGQNPIGVHMSIGSGVPLDIVIVGVSRNAQLDNLRQVPPPFYFLPFAQVAKPTEPAVQGVFLVRTRNADPALPSAIQHLVSYLDATLPVTNMTKMQVQIRNTVYQDRAVATLTAASGLLALLLASLGLYGVVAYAVSRRTAEIGVRMALGADRSSILALVLREALWMTVAGALIGVAAGLALTRTVASQLFNVQPMDISVFTGAVLALLPVALAASAAPSLRAARVDPMTALRYE